MNKCFADRGRFCNALTEKKCDKCSYYKTVNDYDLDKVSSANYLINLDNNLFDKLNTKYDLERIYGGLLNDRNLRR